MNVGKLNENGLAGVPTSGDRSAGWSLADIAASSLTAEAWSAGAERGDGGVASSLAVGSWTTGSEGKKVWASSSIGHCGASDAPLEVGSSWAKLAWAAALDSLTAFLSSRSD